MDLIFVTDGPYGETPYILGYSQDHYLWDKMFKGETFSF